MGLKASTNKHSYGCPENFTQKDESIPATPINVVLPKQGDERNDSFSCEAPSEEMKVPVRKEDPSHYTLEIESLEFLSKILKKSGVNRYESPEFEVSGCKWRLILYPEGDSQRNGDGHISLYLEIMGIQKLSPGWEIDALLNFFVYDNSQEHYRSFQDGKVKRFSAIKTEWGFSRLISLEKLESTSKGNLHGSSSSCKFGVEVFVLKSEGKGERFCTIDNHKNNYFTWKIEKFSKIKEETESNEFTVGDYKWKLRLYVPKEEKEEYLSIFLYLQESEKVLTNGRKMHVEFKLLIRDPSYGNNWEKTIKEGNAWFSGFETCGWGFRKFIKMTELKKMEGLSLYDDMIVEAEISSISITEELQPKPKDTATSAAST